MKKKFVKEKTFCSCGQVSLEYMLILAAFFSALAIALPAITYSTNEFKIASDSLLAKSIFEKAREQISLFDFLADGSEKIFEFTPTKMIFVESSADKLTISSEKKSFTIKKENNLGFSKEFSSKFFMRIKKESSIVSIEFYS